MIGIEIMIAQIAAAAYFGYKQCKISGRRHWSPFDLFFDFRSSASTEASAKEQEAPSFTAEQLEEPQAKPSDAVLEDRIARPSSTNSGRARNHRSSSTSSVAIISWPPMPRKPISSSIPLPTQRRNDIRLMTKKKVLTTINVKNLAACPPQIFTLHNDYYSQ